MIELLPVESMRFKVFEDIALGNLAIQPGEISGDTKIAPGAADDRVIVYGIPRSHCLSSYVICRMMTAHVSARPDFDELAKRDRIEQCHRERGKGCIPRKTQGRKHVPAQSQIGWAIN